MARTLRLAVELARDSQIFNPIIDVTNNGVIPTTPGYTLPGQLTLKLANRCDKIEVEGQATFALVNSTETATTDSFGVVFSLYSNGNLVYQTESLLSGLAIPVPVSPNFSNYIWTLPINFEERPALNVMQDTVVYTAVITRIGSLATNTNTIYIVQGTIDAEEKGTNDNCFPGCGYIPRPVPQP